MLRVQRKTTLTQTASTSAEQGNVTDEGEHIPAKIIKIQKPSEKDNKEMMSTVQSVSLKLTEYRDQEGYNSEDSSQYSDDSEEEDSEGSITIQCSRPPEDSGSSVVIVEENDSVEKDERDTKKKLRKRASKFSEEENLMMCQLVCPCFKYIFSREKSAEDLKKKEDVWNNVATAVSSISDVTRSAYNCRRRFQDCKAKVQEKMAREKITNVYYSKWERKLRDALIRNPNLGRRKGTKRKKNVKRVVTKMDKKAESSENDSDEQKLVIDEVANNQTNSDDSEKGIKRIKDVHEQPKQQWSKETCDAIEEISEKDISSENEVENKEDDQSSNNDSFVLTNQQRFSTSDLSSNVADTMLEGNVNNLQTPSIDSFSKKVNTIKSVNVQIHQVQSTQSCADNTSLTIDNQNAAPSVRPKRLATKNYKMHSDFVYSSAVHSLERKNKSLKEKDISGLIEKRKSATQEANVITEEPCNASAPVEGPKQSGRKPGVVYDSEADGACSGNIDYSSPIDALLSKIKTQACRSVSSDIADAVLIKKTSLLMEQILTNSKNIFDLMTLLLDNVKYVQENQLEILKRQSKILAAHTDSA